LLFLPRPGAPPTRKRGKLARKPTGPADMERMATAFTERRYGTAVRTRFYGNGYGRTET